PHWWSRSLQSCLSAFQERRHRGRLGLGSILHRSASTACDPGATCSPRVNCFVWVYLPSRSAARKTPLEGATTLKIGLLDSLAPSMLRLLGLRTETASSAPGKSVHQKSDIRSPALLSPSPGTSWK